MAACFTSKTFWTLHLICLCSVLGNCHNRFWRNCEEKPRDVEDLGLLHCQQPKFRSHKSFDQRLKSWKKVATPGLLEQIHNKIFPALQRLTKSPILGRLQVVNLVQVCSCKISNKRPAIQSGGIQYQEGKQQCPSCSHAHLSPPTIRTAHVPVGAVSSSL